MSDERIQTGPRAHPLLADPSPASEEGRHAGATDIVLPATDAMDVFFAWEKLRLLYNGILFLVVFTYLRWISTHLRLVEFLGLALFANICFCVGPVAEGYLCWMGFPRVASRRWLFLLGTFLATLFASGQCTLILLGV